MGLVADPPLSPYAQVIEAFSLCIVFAPSFLNSPEWSPLFNITTGAPAPGSSLDPVSLRSRSRNDSNTVSMLLYVFIALVLFYNS